MQSVRVRFAPSPTGALHIGGVRTALYNYLFAKQNGGTFILRVEDTDQTRYVPGAEDYIMEALNWIGLEFDEGPNHGGAYGPYRQSERKDIYKKYAEQLVASGKAYYAYDTSEELSAARDLDPNFKYGTAVRMSMRNSLTASEEEINNLKDHPSTVIRLKFPDSGEIHVSDEIRGDVVFNTSELDDKVILKGDGMPTYHLANIVDDHLMQITHVIRGEEWLPSTAHHVFMYDSFGWDTPKFAHLPLILKPQGSGKLSKRDGAKFGIPVFPLNWDGGDEVFPGFREEGYLPEAMINFLAILGWSSKTDQEIFSLDELKELFSLDNIVKSGARFDIDKALWYNQQYIIAKSDTDIAGLISDQSKNLGYDLSMDQLAEIARMMKERVNKLPEILTTGYYLATKPIEFDEKTLTKKLKEENIPHLKSIADLIGKSTIESAEEMAELIKGYITDNSLGMGAIMPILRIGLTGTMKGPDLFETIIYLGPEESRDRILHVLDL